MKIPFLFSLILILLVFSQCKHENENNENLVSKHNGTKSHNDGTNCMNCHKSGGNAEGFFTIAGSVYDSLAQHVYPNATIRLYSGANGTGTLIASVEVDAKGNFYTTEKVDFGSGLYPSVTGTTGNKNYMSSKTLSGACASCHGTTTAVIWAK